MEATIELHPGLYVYAIVSGENDLHFGSIGLSAHDVWSVVSSGFTAVVSKCPGRKIRPERRNLKMHHEVLGRLLDQPAVLPMSFGLCAPSEDALRRFIADNVTALEGNLQRVAGCHEWGLRVSLTQQDLAEWTVRNSPDLTQQRQALIQRGYEPSRDERIRLGQHIAQALEELRQQYAARVEAGLQLVCSAVQNLGVKSDSDLCNFALLVHHAKKEALDQSLTALAQQLPDEFEISFTGPFAAFNFVGIALDAKALRSEESLES